MTFIQAKNFTESSARRIDLLVLHSMESSEGRDTAETVAKWFAGPSAPQASAHFCIDSDSIVQCVQLDDVAWHAPGANHDGIGLEHAGRAAQARIEWLDEYGRAMLELSARLAAHLCRRFRIPPVFVGSDALRTGGARGITTHADVTRAFRRSTHTDPGFGFPVDWYVQRVAALMSESDPLSARSALVVPL